MPLELLPPLDPPELDDDNVHGGTISSVTLLLAGRTSSFCGLDPPELLEELLDELCAASAPPGVSRTVLEGGGVDELELLELELLEELEELWHG